MRVSKLPYLIPKFLIRDWDIIVLDFLVTAYSVIFGVLSILRHDHFASSYDLANMGQTVWNTLHGRPFALSGAEDTISRFSIHADLILVLISPLYLIWNNVRTLLVAQSVALGLGAVPVYFLAKKILARGDENSSFSEVAAMLLVVVYLLNPGMEWTNIYDFHGVALAIPLLLATYYFAYTKKWLLFWVFAALSMITKEEVALLISSIGLVLFFVFGEKRAGTLAFVTGILWFVLMVFIMIPAFSSNGQDWGLGSLYAQAKSEILEIRTPSQGVELFQGYFFDSNALDYYVNLLKPFSFMPIVGIPWLMLAVPEFVINLLSSNAFMRSLTLHYTSGITPFLVISTIYGLSYLADALALITFFRKYRSIALLLAAVFMTVVAFRVNYHYSPLPTTPSCWCLSYEVTQEDIDFENVLRTLPQNASVTSSSEIRAHLTRRENSFTLPGDVSTADYVAILDQNRIVGDYSPKEFENSLLKDKQFLKTHRLIYRSKHFYLFKKLARSP